MAEMESNQPDAAAQSGPGTRRVETAGIAAPPKSFPIGAHVGIAVAACAVGVGLGAWARTFIPKPYSPSGSSVGAMMGGPGGAGAGQQRDNARALVRTINSLDLIGKAQAKGLTADQQQKLRPILLEVQKSDPLTEEKADQLGKQIQAVLTDDQKSTLAELAPARGRGGGGPGGPGGGQGGGARGSGGPPGAGAAPGGGSPRAGGGSPGGSGGGPRMDWDHPFKEGPAREHLDHLSGGH
jgi:hypothetical protein